MPALDEFVERYSREYDYYEQLARICQRQCEITLERNGIRAIVTARAKRLDHLKEKLENRQQKRGTEYETVDEIAADIVDLAGIRIALYFPGDLDRVERLLTEQFHAHASKTFPHAPAPST